MMKTLTAVTPAVLSEIEREKTILGTQNLFVIFDMGSGADLIQKTLVNEFGRDGLFVAFDPIYVRHDEIVRLQPKGIFISDGPGSVFIEGTSKDFDSDILDLDIKVLGIGSGAHIVYRKLQKTRPMSFGADLGYQSSMLDFVLEDSPLMHGCALCTSVLEKTGVILKANNVDLFESARTGSSASAAFERFGLYGTMFDPFHKGTECGELVFTNFIERICLERYKGMPFIKPSDRDPILKMLPAA